MIFDDHSIKGKLSKTLDIHINQHFTWWVLLNWFLSCWFLRSWFLSSWFLSSCRPVVAGLAGPWVACTEEAAALVRAARVVVNVAIFARSALLTAVTTPMRAPVAVGVTLTGTCHTQTHKYWLTFTFTNVICLRCHRQQTSCYRNTHKSQYKHG